MTHHRHDLLREGLVTGTLGAAAVAGWFLLIDVLQGRPLATPSILGQVVLYGRHRTVVEGPDLSAAVWCVLLQKKTPVNTRAADLQRQVI